ncbi:hypothetical protein P5V15_013619 [Pogonomyrmex californicus]
MKRSSKTAPRDGAPRSAADRVLGEASGNSAEIRNSPHRCETWSERKERGKNEEEIREERKNENLRRCKQKKRIIARGERERRKKKVIKKEKGRRGGRMDA